MDTHYFHTLLRWHTVRSVGYFLHFRTKNKRCSSTILFSSSSADMSNVLHHLTGKRQPKLPSLLFLVNLFFILVGRILLKSSRSKSIQCFFAFQINSPPKVRLDHWPYFPFHGQPTRISTGIRCVAVDAKLMRVERRLSDLSTFHSLFAACVGCWTINDLIRSFSIRCFFLLNIRIRSIKVI